MATIVTRTVAQDGSVTLAESDQTLIETGMDAVLMPLSALSKSDEFVNKQTAGLTAIGYGIAGFMAGDKWGEQVPLLGQRR